MDQGAAMWREMIRELCPEATFSDPATNESIAAAEAALGVSFPEEFASLLRESNGVADDTGADVIWSCEKLVRENHMYRNGDFDDLYMPFDHLLFFGEAGNGDLYAYAILRGVIRTSFKIYIWDHEDDSRTCWAFGLERYLQQALLGLEPGEPAPAK